MKKRRLRNVAVFWAAISEANLLDRVWTLYRFGPIAQCQHRVNRVTFRRERVRPLYPHKRQKTGHCGSSGLGRSRHPDEARLLLTRSGPLLVNDFAMRNSDDHHLRAFGLPAIDFATSRAHWMNTCTAGLSVRFLSVTIATGDG